MNEMVNKSGVFNTNENTLDEKKVILFHNEQFELWSMENPSSKDFYNFESTLKKRRIHFYFNQGGKTKFAFSPFYSRELDSGKNYFFFHPDEPLHFHLILPPNTVLLGLELGLESLHQLFTVDDKQLAFLKPENVNRKFYDEREINHQLLLCINQILQTSLNEQSLNLFYQGKVFELLSYYFSQDNHALDKCPYLSTDEPIRKIKLAKDYITAHLFNPPSLKELAKIAGLNELQLKNGFKEVYGSTVYAYILDKKIQKAHELLLQGQLQVNEVAYKIGYANPSHFINAYKKKYGQTPKQDMLQKSGQ